MKRETLFEEIKKLRRAEMIRNQLISYELVLKKKGLKDTTVSRKVNDIGMFILYMNELRSNDLKVTWTTVNDIAFTYVRDNYFSKENLYGTYEYRIQIFNNIKQGFNYIYKYLDTEIQELTDYQKEILKDLSKNNWFHCSKEENEENVNNTMQTKLLEELGLKVYFDNDNKPYVYSHETAELIGKENKDIMKSCRLIKERFSQAKNFAQLINVDISTIEDTYVIKKKDGKTDKKETYRMSKDLIMHYILSLSGEKYSVFKFEYQDAFNYIEEEYNKILKAHGKLKERFLEMYEQLRIQNRDILIGKKSKNKAA